MRGVVRAMLVATSKRTALARAQRMLDAYLALADGLDEQTGARVVEVPPMPGVDEEMRRWSFFMLLEHNTIVNRSITALTRQLALGEELSGAALLDPKRDVLPGGSVGSGIVGEFRRTVEEHVAVVEGLGKLRGNGRVPHPLFGEFDAHKWNGMFALHLRVHMRQAKIVASAAARD